MKNPLRHRFLRNLKENFSKYLVLFLFLSLSIAIVSGWEVASSSIQLAYDSSFATYHIEDGNFELLSEASAEFLTDIAEAESIAIYENSYVERSVVQNGSTLRIFQKRVDIDLECLMDGAFPVSADEIAVDRLYAENNSLSIGDTITLGNCDYTIVGFVALSDYSALFSSTSDIMFDSLLFGVAIVSEEGFARFDAVAYHYIYAWEYAVTPSDASVAKEWGDSLLATLSDLVSQYDNQIIGYTPQYLNTAITYAGEDLEGDSLILTIFLYLVIALVAFLFAIFVSQTITQESAVIGTLRAMGYTKHELIWHYMLVPTIVTFLSALVGNILGYTLVEGYAADAYYTSYSMSSYEVIWNTSVFWQSTLIPIVIMLGIHYLVLRTKLGNSPLDFLRQALEQAKNRLVLPLRGTISILTRFRLRVIFQNLRLYLGLFLGIFLANLLLLFALLFPPLLEKIQTDITENMLSTYQYILKTEYPTKETSAESYLVTTLSTLEGTLSAEDITIYGISSESEYVAMDDGITISSAFADKFGVAVGDTITLKEQFTTKEYSFTVTGIYEYQAALCVFCGEDYVRDHFATYYYGYFSSVQLDDIPEEYIATCITIDDLTKLSRQLTHSMGDMMDMVVGFAVIMFVLLLYFLSKLVVEKNTNSIAMGKVLGFTNGELDCIYSLSSGIVTMVSLLVTLPLSGALLKFICVEMFRQYPGYLPYYADPSIYVKAAILGICSYVVVSLFLRKQIGRISLDSVLRGGE